MLRKHDPKLKAELSKYRLEEIKAKMDNPIDFSSHFISPDKMKCDLDYYYGPFDIPLEDDAGKFPKEFNETDMEKHKYCVESMIDHFLEGNKDFKDMHMRQYLFGIVSTITDDLRKYLKYFKIDFTLIFNLTNKNMTYGYSLQFLPYRPTRGAINIDKVIYFGEIFTDKELFSEYLRRVYLDIYSKFTSKKLRYYHKRKEKGKMYERDHYTETIINLATNDAFRKNLIEQLKPGNPIYVFIGRSNESGDDACMICHQLIQPDKTEQKV